ncbi:BREX system Lon protease-like protein BrxL [Cyanobium sp. Cruz CV13-4-11]|uniref:BREX system Lon protease-like protein BrxL n=1 Tax=unclassified Cyanobium TaxID=2627006 RepID=UPI0020CF535E|nr:MULTISPECIES: BREX system Lon protease-like protein BrxL [unclassified Cyanobium]MCP9899320.1 BREX system Lon protease-like protein BrxL [Cyanobium sp. Cruz CV11-17]MCP9917935.1 BREX system Lon protease-like protein BrxL [Cyanobium sp. Cruz CV13-4-11]
MTPTTTPAAHSPLDQKILEHFPGLVVRKDLTTELKQNAVVPTYVLEYLLGQHCATDDPTLIAEGLGTVRRILAKHYVHRNQAELVKSTIKDKGTHKVIDKLTVTFNDKAGFHEVEFTNLGIKKVPIDDSYVKRYPKLLVGGIWAITDVEYELPVDPKSSPWQIAGVKPIQVAGVDHEAFLAARAQFSTDEWMDVLMQSVGFNPEHFSRRAKLLTLIRLIPYCERNYNLLELGPKGTGKSHIFAEFSPHGMLISGSEVTAPKLFVSNANGKIGLVGYWDCICFDEFAGKDKKVDKTLVDIMKNYMANRTFSRGIEQLTAEASMVFMGNTQKSVAYMLKHSHFYEPLPDKYIDSAFLDRIHAFNPGWEVAPVRHELFCTGYGFVVDYIAEVLKHLRTEDYTGLYKPFFEVTSEVSTRDQTGFEKTFSGLMKILHPNGKATPEEIGDLLNFAMECRRRVREQILRIDDTFKPNDFAYRNQQSGTEVLVLTPEEQQYPAFSGPRLQQPDAPGPVEQAPQETPELSTSSLQEHHLVVPENSRGWSYRRLFGDYLIGASGIIIRDPYIRAFHQIRNLVEFLRMVNEITPIGDEVSVHLITSSDQESMEKQVENLGQVQDSFAGTSTPFTWEIDASPNFHARSITASTGWKITLDRGLDLFQWFEFNAFNAAAVVQEARLVKGCEINFIAMKP